MWPRLALAGIGLPELDLHNIVLVLLKAYRTDAKLFFFSLNFFFEDILNNTIYICIILIFS